jgi:hypothetical protein
MAFEERELDEIRSRVVLSDLIGKKNALRKQGSEFVMADNPSFTISDSKGFYKEFGNGGEKPGDCFDYLQTFEGYSFVDAVKELAQQVGVTLSGDAGRAVGKPDRARAVASPKPEQRTGGDSGPSPDGEGRARRDAAKAQGKNEIVKAWQYYSPEGTLLYETIRSQKRLPDGSWHLTKEGKPWKTFMQRRPSPEGEWIWSLSTDDGRGNPQEFMLYKDTWMRFDEKKFVDWKLTQRRYFTDLPPIEPWLYNAADVAPELTEERDEQRTIFLPEGEAKVDVLIEWGLLAVTNSGGAGNFTQACAEFFRNARDVVILKDNDKAGSERADKIGAMLTAVGAGVRTLNFKDVWPACPVKGDVKDWRESGGTREQLLEIVDGLPAWTPKPYESKYGARTARDLGAPVRAYPWRIKGIVPMDDNLLIMGPSRSGKTFETLDMAMHVHFGKQFAGKKVTPGGFVYLTYEGATGFENRLRAYLKHHGIHPEDLHSFAWLTRPPNLYADEDNAISLAEDILKLAERFKLPYAATIVDTHNAATRGSSEIKSEDLNKIMNNYAIVKDKTACPLWIVGHTNAEGKHRGNEIFFNNIEAALLVERVFEDDKQHGKGANVKEKRDEDGRVMRRVKVNKQREGDDGLNWSFVLSKVKIGVDEDGDDITSMVSVEPTQHIPDSVIENSNKDRPEGFFLTDNNAGLFKALLRVMNSSLAMKPPAGLEVGRDVMYVVRWVDLGLEYKKTVPQEEGETHDKYRNKMKAQTKRFRDQLLPANVIGISEMPDPDHVPEEGERQRMIHYVWPTGKRVFGRGIQWPPAPKKKKQEPIVDQATGQEITSMGDEPPSTVF